MLRLSDGPLSSRIGGWAPIDSPPRRTASSGRQWSLAIGVAAALVAMSAVVFDLRLPSGVSLPTVLPSPQVSTETTPRTASESAAASNAARPAASSATEAEGGTVRSAVSESGGESVAPVSSAVPAASGASAASTSSNAASEGAAAFTEVRAETSAPAEASEPAAAVVDDPASRIREYLGLHAGAQLPVSFSYEVQEGDTASSIAERFGLEEATVLFNNFDIYDANHLTVGQLLTLPPVDGLVYTVQPGDVFDALMANFQGDRSKTLAYAANGVTSPDQIYAGQQLLLVHGSASIAASGSGAATSGAQPAAVWTEPTFVWPLGYDKISDPFGTPRANSVGYHTGVDFTAAVGTIVGSTAAGQVTVATWDPSYGNWVEIDHGGGYRSRYAHLDEIWVREGEWLQSNAYIGTVGNTGNSSGAHLHFEIIINGQAVNPLAWLN